MGLFETLAARNEVSRLKESGGVGWEEKKSFTIQNGDTTAVLPVSDLVGCEVVDKVPGRAFLGTPAEKPAAEGFLLSSNKAPRLDIDYGDGGGVLSKPCLFVYSQTLGSFCPAFFKDESKYQAVMYVFEGVSDTMGLGLTLTKGWYAVNTTTFAYEPFDPEVYPFLYTLDEINKNATAWALEYVKALFPLKETIAYTIRGENILWDDSTALVSYVPIYTEAEALCYGSFVWVVDGRAFRILYGSATITYTETVHPIDPKFLPEGLGGGAEPLVIDLTSYGYISNGTQIPDTTLHGTCMDAVEKRRLIQIKMSCDFGGTKFSEITLLVSGHQYTSKTLGLCATGALVSLSTGQLSDVGIALAITNQGAQVFMGLRAF